MDASSRQWATQPASGWPTPPIPTFNGGGLIWSYGGSIQDEEQNVVINSPEVVEAVKFARALYQETMADEVLSWDDGSNDRFLASGKMPILSSDPTNNPPDKLAVLQTAPEWCVTFGYPGPNSPGIGEVAQSYVILDMIAQAATDKLTPEEAVKWAEFCPVETFTKLGTVTRNRLRVSLRSGRPELEAPYSECGLNRTRPAARATLRGLVRGCAIRKRKGPVSACRAPPKAKAPPEGRAFATIQVPEGPPVDSGRALDCYRDFF